MNNGMNVWLKKILTAEEAAADEIANPVTPITTATLFFAMLFWALDCQFHYDDKLILCGLFEVTPEPRKTFEASFLGEKDIYVEDTEGKEV
jgi:hypothetical protein